MKNFLIKYKEIIMYLIFGVLTTVVSWGSYTVFADCFKLSVFISNILSWICAIIFAYITNKIWVFESKSFKPKDLAKEILTFTASRGITGAIEILLVPLLSKWGFDNLFYVALSNSHITADILFTNGIYSKIFVSVIVVILNYIFSKLIVFKKEN